MEVFEFGVDHVWYNAKSDEIFLAIEEINDGSEWTIIKMICNYISRKDGSLTIETMGLSTEELKKEEWVFLGEI